MTTAPTGERFIPEVMSGELIEAEHQARYRFAMQFAPERDVLDAACGVGWGSQLLLDAGASTVHGIDISPEAIAASRRRAPDVTFTEGDVAQLPYDDDSFDLVACFETIEHVADTRSVFDEIARVLRPGGIALVSSPNPGVYPGGNPFHERELDASELRRELAARFAHVEIWCQHGMFVSALMLDRVTARYEPIPASVLSVADVAPGREPYNVALASDQPLPAMLSTLALSPTDQIEAINEEARRLQEEQARMAEDQTRIIQEREFILEERATMLEQLRTLPELVERTGVAERERDRLGLLLLQAEQRVATLTQQCEELRRTGECAERGDA